jgi:hypothetical protein
MARPKPEVFTSIELTPEITLEVIRGNGVFAVVYDGKPFNLIRRRRDGSAADGKYPHTTFVNRGNATRLARKHNDQFGTDLFTVVEPVMDAADRAVSMMETILEAHAEASRDL